MGEIIALTVKQREDDLGNFVGLQLLFLAATWQENCLSVIHEYGTSLWLMVVQYITEFILCIVSNKNVQWPLGVIFQQCPVPDTVSAVNLIMMFSSPKNGITCDTVSAR